MSDTEIRLIDIGDADAIAAHRARDADAFARWEPSRPADFYTADGQPGGSTPGSHCHPRSPREDRARSAACRPAPTGSPPAAPTGCPDCGNPPPALVVPAQTVFAVRVAGVGCVGGASAGVRWPEPVQRAAHSVSVQARETGREVPAVVLRVGTPALGAGGHRDSPVRQPDNAARRSAALVRGRLPHRADRRTDRAGNLATGLGGLPDDPPLSGPWGPIHRPGHRAAACAASGCSGRPGRGRRCRRR